MAESGDLENWGEMTSMLDPKQRLSHTERLLEEHQASVFRYAFRLCGCAAAAEDIAQEVFLSAFRNVHQLRSPEASRGWLMAIARNEFIRWGRKSAAAGVVVDPQLSQALEQDETLEPTIDRQEWVERALQQLPEDYRIVLLMYYFEELSYAQIAEQLKIPMGTVMSRLSRGKAHMKSTLDQIDTPTPKHPSAR